MNQISNAVTKQVIQLKIENLMYNFNHLIKNRV